MNDIELNNKQVETVTVNESDSDIENKGEFDLISYSNQDNDKTGSNRIYNKFGNVICLFYINKENPLITIGPDCKCNLIIFR